MSYRRVCIVSLFLFLLPDTKWLPSNDFTPTPVRAHVKGQIVDWPVTRDFEHFYEYFDYQLDIGPDTSVFEVGEKG